MDYSLINANVNACFFCLVFIEHLSLIEFEKISILTEKEIAQKYHLRKPFGTLKL